MYNHNKNYIINGSWGLKDYKYQTNNSKKKIYSKFKNSFSFEQRICETSRISNLHPDRIPVICEKSSYSDVPDISKHKYLIPLDLTIGEFIFVIRKNIKLQSYEALFLMINDIIPSTTMRFNELYWNYKDPDGFLYIVYTKENTFG